MDELVIELRRRAVAGEQKATLGREFGMSRETATGFASPCLRAHSVLMSPYYDADGSGAGAAVQIATPVTGLPLTNGDFAFTGIYGPIRSSSHHRCLSSMRGRCLHAGACLRSAR